jgi:hypothetical protein
VQLTSTRLEVTKGERIRAVLLVHPSIVAVLAAGGPDHLRHELEDVGFRVLHLFMEFPLDWHRGGDIPAPSDLEWLLWTELEPRSSASFRRELTEDLRVVDAWTLDEEIARPLARPHLFYSLERGAAALLDGRVIVFGIAYPLTRGEGAAP